MKLVICFDGTWNEASTRTNVWKLKQDLDCSGDTQATYIEGIGTVAGDELLSGMFAADFDRPLGLAYRWLSKKVLNAPKDTDIALYLFGFSRGGYLAHTFSWMIHELGLPSKFASAIPLAAAYAEKDAKSIDKLRKGGIVPAPKVEMLGLWDAVSSPHDIYCGYHDGEKAPNVRRIYHAMATDERRKLYGAMQYHRQRGVNQRWFSGVHKDVGGGYPADECELSDVALAWMKGNALKCGLAFKSPLAAKPRRYDFSSLKKVHNEEMAIDPIKCRTFCLGERIDRSVRDRIRTQEGYFPSISAIPSSLLDWLRGRIPHPRRRPTYNSSTPPPANS